MTADEVDVGPFRRMPVGIFAHVEYRAVGATPPDWPGVDDRSILYQGRVIGRDITNGITLQLFDAWDGLPGDELVVPMDQLYVDDRHDSRRMPWTALVGWRFYGSARDMRFAYVLDHALRGHKAWDRVVNFDTWDALDRKS